MKIVTGDTYGTAREIGRQIGIWDDDHDSEENIITGVDFEQLSDKEALSRVQHLKIMCRARPTDKQRLVSLLKQKGEIVAVTAGFPSSILEKSLTSTDGSPSTVPFNTVAICCAEKDICIRNYKKDFYFFFKTAN